MTRIKIADVRIKGWIHCQHQCVFQHSCANHETAGDFRSEDGFTPEVTIENNEVFCNTMGQDISEEITYEILPENYDKLGRGGLFFQDGNLKTYSLYDD